MYPAHIRLTPDGDWGLYDGDGSETEPVLLAVGDPFEPGVAIWDAVASLEAWAHDHGYTLVTPHFVGDDVPLDSLIAPDDTDRDADEMTDR